MNLTVTIDDLDYYIRIQLFYEIKELLVFNCIALTDFLN